MKSLEQLSFTDTYRQLPDIFYSGHDVEPLRDQFLVHFNDDVAVNLELDPAEALRTDFVDRLFGNQYLSGQSPIALCYAGHQFGHFVPRLGDGRAMLIGEVITGKNQKWDLQLKGAGKTLYSRNGDGKAVLRSTIREYLCSAAMQGLAIPTTQALCMTGSSEEVYREQIETGAMLIRVAPSHIRFGTFEYFYYSQRYDDLKLLADYTIEHYFPELQQHNNPYQKLLSDVVKSTASLIAQWQSVGFSHGVMNSDNMSIHGLTLDYGPYGFLDEYDPGFICNHSDHSGRYAFDKQPDVGLFNLSCLAQALLPLLDDDPDTAVEIAKHELDQYASQYVTFYSGIMSKKLGFVDVRIEYKELIDKLLALMASNKVDYTMFFRALSEESLEVVRERACNLFLDRDACSGWLDEYEKHLIDAGLPNEARSAQMKQLNPKYILRNYMAEVAIREATVDEDYSEIDRLIKILRTPFDEHDAFEHYAGHPPGWAQQISVSCSS